MDIMKVLTPQALQQLVINHQEQAPLKGTRRERDLVPVCKLFLPWAAATWLLTEMDDDGLAFGLCDLGHGTPEIGYVSLDEVFELSGPGGLKVEQDVHFRPDKSLGRYADEARRLGYIRV